MPETGQQVGTRQRVEDSAALLFRRQGYAATGLKQIAAESGAAFPGGKADLGDHVVRRAGAAYRDLVATALGGDADPETAVLSMFDAAARALVESDYADACPIATLALEVASTDERLRMATEAVFADWVDTATAWFGQWVPRPADRDLATSLIMLLEGAFLLARAARDPGPLHIAGQSMVTLHRSG